MSRHLITISFMLLVSSNIVSCGPNVRAQRSYRQNDWVMENADSNAWVMDTSESNEEHTRSIDDYIFIGDMAFRKDVFASDIQANGSVQYSMIKDKRRIWSDGQMPIKIQPSVGWVARKAIKAAMDAFQKETCIRIIKYDPSRHHNYVHIIASRPGCSSQVGQTGGVQELNLQPWQHCDRASTVIHEFMHALGFFHEQSRYDRDDYIEVLWDNIAPDPTAKFQFQKQSKAEMMDLGVSYDYGSIMHYGVFQASKDGYSPSFRVLRTYDGPTIGKAEYFSQADIRKLNLLYGCDRTRGDDGDDAGDDDEPTIRRPTRPRVPIDDDDDDDEPTIRRPIRPPAPIDDEDGEIGTACGNGCCCTCKCSGFACFCNCPCTCVRYIDGGLTKYNCNCQCNRLIFVPNLYNYRVIPQWKCKLD